MSAHRTKIRITARFITHDGLDTCSSSFEQNTRAVAVLHIDTETP
jgi:hypothetical protein